MPARTPYLLDKVIVRYTLDGMLSLSLGRDLTDQQIAAFRLFQNAATRSVDLFIQLLESCDAQDWPCWTPSPRRDATAGRR